MSNSNNNLPDLYYRFFCCSSCGYQSHVAGEKFFDEAYQNFMDTFHCLDCNVIHEKMVTELEDGLTLPAYLELKEIFPEFDLHLPVSFKDLSSSEMIRYIENRAVENIECYSCGSGHNINWSKELPYCPKCRETMEMKYKDRPVPLEVVLYGNEEQQKLHQFAIDQPVLMRELISAYYSFTEDEIFKYRIWIKWKYGSSNVDIQWNRKMIDHCRYYFDWEKVLQCSFLKNAEFIAEFIPDLKHHPFSDDVVSWLLATNEHIHWTEELIDRYINRIDFAGLSLNSNVDWSEHILKKYEDRWDWFEMINENIDIPWTLPMMEMSFSKIDQIGLLQEILECNEGMISNIDIVTKYFKWFDTGLIFSNIKLPWLKENLLERWADKLDWDGLSQNQELLRDPRFFEQNMEHWLADDAKRFSYLSSCVTLPWTNEFIERFYELWDWDNLSYNPALPWSEEFIDQYADNWDWGGIFSNSGIPWTIDLILKYDLPDEEDMLTNRSIWDKAFKPHLDKDIIEIFYSQL